MAGPMGPSLDGSLLWQATQLATNTALPLSQSAFFADFEDSSESLEQATTVNTHKAIESRLIQIIMFDRSPTGKTVTGGEICSEVAPTRGGHAAHACFIIESLVAVGIA